MLVFRPHIKTGKELTKTLMRDVGYCSWTSRVLMRMQIYINNENYICLVFQY
jgi:hypothetical protein